MYNIWFDICSIFILITLLAVIYIKNSLPLLQNKLFTVLVWMVLISTTCDLIAGVWGNIHHQLDYVPHLFLYLVNFLYFVFRDCTSFVYALYIIAVLNLEYKSLTQLFLLFAPISINLLFITLTPLTGWIFSMDQYGIYERGPLLPVLYLIAIYYMAMALSLVIHYRRFIPFAQRIAFLTFALLALGTVFIQGLFPTMLVEGFGTALCVLLLYMTIQRPDEMLDGQSRLLNKNAFITMLDLKFQQKADFEVISIVVDDVTFIEKSLSLDVVSRVSASVGAWFHKTVKNATVYRISDGRFCLISRRYVPEVLDKLAELVINRFNQPWKVDEFNINLPSYYTRIRCPQDAASPEKVLDLIDMVPRNVSRPAPALISVCDLDVKSKERERELKKILHNALAEGMLEVYYQPIYCVERGQFVSAEALLRLKHPTLGFIPPDEFIPLAEETGDIIPFGQFVLDNVCRFLSQNQLWKYQIEYIEVNLSIVECLQDDLGKNILATLNRYNLDPRYINLEITETAASAMSDTVHHNLTRLWEEGIRFSLDDYGTGYSNITRMLTMPLDMIKIDKTLTQAMSCTSGKNKVHTVLSNTFRMLDELDMKALVEGVETEGQAQQLIRIGCDFIQGFYYARPMPEDKFLQLLSS